MVTIARLLNLTLVVPELDKKSFWADRRYIICYEKIKEYSLIWLRCVILKLFYFFLFLQWLRGYI